MKILNKLKMNRNITIFFLFLFCNGEAQIYGVQHYKIEINKISINGYNYSVDLLTLKNDSSFQLIYQSFSNRKEKRNGIIKEIEKIEGKWKSVGDTIIISPNTGNAGYNTVRFINKGKYIYTEEIYRYRNIKNIRKFRWKKFKNRE